MLYHIDNKRAMLPPFPNAQVVKLAVKKFADDSLEKRGCEIQDAHAFCISWLTDVYGVQHAYEYIRFERRGGRRLLDAIVDRNGVGALIVQKHSDVDLDTKKRQRKGSMLTPCEEVRNYYNTSSCCIC